VRFCVCVMECPHELILIVSHPIQTNQQEIGDLLQEEWDDIWNAAPKFPDLEGSAEASQQRIDVDSFIQIYRDIDDIFEEDGDEGDDDGEKKDDVDAVDTDTAAAVATDEGKEDNAEDDVSVEEGDEKELEMSFSKICDDAGLVSKNALQNWSEIKDLLKENLLSLEEFEEMWERTAKSPGSMEMIDVEGFLSFNVALDDLFDFADEDNDAPIAMFYADDLPPGVIFSEIADDNVLVGMEELKTWGDLQDMLREGDLLPLELQNMFEAIPKASGTNDKVNEEGFESLFEAINALFEDDDDDDDSEKVVNEGTPETTNEAEVPAAAAADEPEISSRIELLALITELALDDRLPCGLESTDTEVELMLEIAAKLQKESTNMIGSEPEIEIANLAGVWELIYTTSATMKFNKSLSGMVPPNAKFGGLVQKLEASKYLSDVEYVEQINAGPASFEVKVTGDWELRSTVSLFTGAKSFCLDVVYDRVNYGLKSQKADHWKSLGPLSLLDISYVDEDLRIMRGTTSTDSIFIFKRLS
jgi:hypothetical protein